MGKSWNKSRLSKIRAEQYCHKRGEGRMKKWGAALVAITVVSVQPSRLPACRRDACTTISTNRDSTRIRDRIPGDLIVVVSQENALVRASGHKLAGCGYGA
jgi:hypothetical protein